MNNSKLEGAIVSDTSRRPRDSARRIKIDLDKRQVTAEAARPPKIATPEPVSQVDRIERLADEVWCDVIGSCLSLIHDFVEGCADLSDEQQLALMEQILGEDHYDYAPDCLPAAISQALHDAVFNGAAEC